MGHWLPDSTTSCGVATLPYSFDKEKGVGQSSQRRTKTAVRNLGGVCGSKDSGNPSSHGGGALWKFAGQIHGGEEKRANVGDV